MMKRTRIAPFVSDILKGSLLAVLMTVAANCDTGTKPQPIDSKKPAGTPTGRPSGGSSSSSSSGGLGSSVSSGGGSIASTSSSSGGIGGQGIGGQGIGGGIGGQGIGGGIGGQGIGGGIGGQGIGGGIGGQGIGGGNNGGGSIGGGNNGIAIPNRTPPPRPPGQVTPTTVPNQNGQVQPGETARVTVSFDANGQVAYNISVQQGQAVGAVSYSIGGITPSPGLASSSQSGPRVYSVPYTAEFGMNFTVGSKTCTVVKRVLPATPIVFSTTLNGGLTCTP